MLFHPRRQPPPGKATGVSSRSGVAEEEKATWRSDRRTSAGRASSGDRLSIAFDSVPIGSAGRTAATNRVNRSEKRTRTEHNPSRMAKPRSRKNADSPRERCPSESEPELSAMSFFPGLLGWVLDRMVGSTRGEHAPSCLPFERRRSGTVHHQPFYGAPSHDPRTEAPGNLARHWLQIYLWREHRAATGRPY